MLVGWVHAACCESEARRRLTALEEAVRPAILTQHSMLSQHNICTMPASTECDAQIAAGFRSWMLTMWRCSCNLPLDSPAKASRIPAAPDCFAFKRQASKQLALEISESRRDMSWLYMTSVCFSDCSWAERLSLHSLHLRGWRAPTAPTITNLHLDLRSVVHPVIALQATLYVLSMMLTYWRLLSIFRVNGQLASNRNSQQ